MVAISHVTDKEITEDFFSSEKSIFVWTNRHIHICYLVMIFYCYLYMWSTKDLHSEISDQIVGYVFVFFCFGRLSCVILCKYWNLPKNLGFNFVYLSKFEFEQ